MSAVACMYYYMTCSLLLLHCSTYLALWWLFPTSWGQLNKDSLIHVLLLQGIFLLVRKIGKSCNKSSKKTIKKIPSSIYPRPSGGVRYEPQRFMGETVYGPHFNRNTVEFASRESFERDESKPRIKTLLPFLKNITEESNLENSQDLILALDACYWLHKVISTSSSRFGDDRRCDFSRF